MVLHLMRLLLPSSPNGFMGIPAAQSLVNHIQSRGAARRGKRIERSRLARQNATKRRLLEAQNPKPNKTYKKNIKIDKTQFRFMSDRQLDLTLPPPPADNVFFMDKFKRLRFSFDEAIEFHKQVVHPDVLNQPDALVSATFELTTKMKIKRKKYIEHINSTVCYPHLYTYQTKPRKIVALCKDPADQEKAREAGAFISGGLEIVDQFKKGQLTQRDFDHVVCQTDFLVDFASVKGMKGSPFFPTRQRGNSGDDIVELVYFFKNGVDYSMRKNQDEPESGFIDCHFGKLDMTKDQLRDNFLALMNSINRFKPLNLIDGKQFFERVAIFNSASDENFIIRFWELMEEYQDPETIIVEKDEGEAVAA